MSASSAKRQEQPVVTKDWDHIFENPSSGLIPLIMRTETGNVLRESTLEVFRLLHTRKGDQVLIERFEEQLALIIPADNPDEFFGDKQAAIINILREMKHDRIRRAKAYAARGDDGSDRRDG